MFRGLLLVACFSLLVPCASTAQEAEAPVVDSLVADSTIGLDAFLMLVRLRHPFFEQQQLNPVIEERDRIRYLAEEDWRVRAEPGYTHTEPVSASAFTPTGIDLWTLRGSISRSIWETGGDVSLSLNSVVTDQQLPRFEFPLPGTEQTIRAGVPTLYEHSLSLNYTQPLLQNLGGELDRLEWEVADYTVTTAGLEALESGEEFLLRLANEYITWVLLQEQVQIAAERVELAEQELSVVREQFEANLVDRVDVLRAEDALRSARRELVLLESQLEAQKGQIAVLVQAEELARMQPEYDLYQTITLPDTVVLYTILADSVRPIKTVEVRQEQLDRLQRGFVERRELRLDLILGLGVVAGDETFGGSFGSVSPEYSVSFLVTHLLGTRVAETDIAVTELRLRQLGFQRRNVFLDLKATARRLLIRLADMEEILELNQAAVVSAQERLAAERELYNQGRSQFAFVIQAEDAIRQARLIYAENAASYHRLMLELRELTDGLLPGRAEAGR